MANSQLNQNSSLNDWVRDNLQRCELLEELEIDYCCGGEQRLVEACGGKKLDVHQVMEQLLQIKKEDEEEKILKWEEATPSELVQHIEGTHHVYLKSALPQLSVLIERVVGVHAARHPELNRLAALFRNLRQDLEPHLMKEERVLFPMIREMESTGQTESGFGQGPYRPISVMREEHERAGEILESIRKVSENFAVPEDGCASYEKLMAELKRLEADTHRHIFLENAVLFPRVLGEAPN